MSGWQTPQRLHLGDVIAHSDLAEKFQLKIELYPRLTMAFFLADHEALTSYAEMDRKELLACATTPLERLMILMMTSTQYFQAS